MKVETIEILLIIVIIFIQIVVFLRTRQQIRVFKNIFPKIDTLNVSKVYVRVADLENLPPKVILDSIGQFTGKIQGSPGIFVQSAATSGHSNGEVDTGVEPSVEYKKAEVHTIEHKGYINPVFYNILFSINNYLIRNRGASSDFNLIRDIVERNTSAVEEDINLTISIPLYLGLMGTMLGIVIGLFNMPDLATVIDTESNNLLLNEGITSLISGVKIAMIASFTGLMLTILNSGGSFKGSRTLVETRKNEFYTFVQVELLPVINQGLAATLESLQRNLMRFNGEFATNLVKLGGIFDKSYDTAKAQKELVESLNEAKVSEMMQYNVTVLRQLEVSVREFEKFNGSMMNVNAFVTNSAHMVDRTNELLKRTENFKSIAENLENKLHQSQQLMEFLAAHFDNLEQHKEFTANAVADVGHAISSSFRDLQEHILNSSEAVKQFTVDETETLKRVLSESKTNLGNLQHLSTLTQDVSLFKDSAASQGERTRQRLDELNSKMTAILGLIAKAEEDRSLADQRKLAARLKRLFGAGK